LVDAVQAWGKDALLSLRHGSDRDEVVAGPMAPMRGKIE